MPGLQPQQLELLQRFAQGWLGELFTAREMKSDKIWAIRVIAKEHQAIYPAIQDVLAFHTTATHPHILPLTAIQTQGDNFFYSMPLIASGSLRQWLDQPQTPEQHTELLEIIRQTAESLRFAHSQGVVHGNLKPENLLLHRDEAALQVMLSDCQFNTLRPPDHYSPYLPHEQRQGAQATIQSDLYGIGALLFEGLTRKALPLNPTPRDLEDLPDTLRRMVTRLLGLQVVPYIDTAVFLGRLRAAQLSEQNEHPSAPSLRTDELQLSASPGNSLSVPLHLRLPQATEITLTTEGLPPEWVQPTPVLSVPANSEVPVSWQLQVPQSFTVKPRSYEFHVSATDSQHRILASLAMQLRILPFSATTLNLQPAHSTVGRSATVGVEVINESNQPQQYNLELTLPAGSQLRHGTARKQFELVPGGQYHDTLEVLLPASLLRHQERTFVALAHSLARIPTSPEAAWPPPHHTTQATTQVKQRPLVPWWTALLLGAGLLGGLGWASLPPQISTFTVEGKSPQQGEPFSLSWQTKGAKHVRLAELPGQTFDPQGSVSVQGLKSTRTYTLIASGWLTQKSQQLTVTPVAPTPSIVSFTVTPPQANWGQTIQVQWQVKNANKVHLTPFGVVPAKGTRPFKLSADTRFDLHAQRGEKADPSDAHSSLKAVLQPPRIAQFQLSPTSLKRGSQVKVSWQVSGAKEVRMAPLGTLPASGTRTFVPERGGTYTLKASNGQKEVSTAAELQLLAPNALITRFSVNPKTATVGDPLTVRWQTQGTRRAELRWGDQQQTVPPSGELTLTASRPMQTMSLVVENASGEPVLATQQVTIKNPVVPVVKPPIVSRPKPKPAPVAPPTPTTSPPAAAKPKPQPTASTAPTPAPVKTPSKPAPAPAPVRIVTFQVSPTSTTVGQKISLSWQVTGEKKVRLTQGGVPIGQFGNVGRLSFIAKQSGTQAYTISSITRPTVRLTRLVQVAAPPTKPGPSKPLPQPQTKPPSGFKAPAGNVPIAINQFKAIPTELRPGQAATLIWKVSGVRKVFITGLRGPNVDGSFPPTGSARTPKSNGQSLSYTLSTGSLKRTLTIPSRDSARTPDSASASSQYSGLAGVWRHSAGQLQLRVVGNRASGTITSTSSDLPSGSFQGTLTGEGTSPVMSGFLGQGADRVAIIMHFDPAQMAFEGFYASRAERVKWCGWRGNLRPNGC